MRNKNIANSCENEKLLYKHDQNMTAEVMTVEVT